MSEKLVKHFEEQTLRRQKTGEHTKLKAPCCHHTGRSLVGGDAFQVKASVRGLLSGPGKKARPVFIFRRIRRRRADRPDAYAIEPPGLEEKRVHTKRTTPVSRSLASFATGAERLRSLAEAKHTLEFGKVPPQPARVSRGEDIGVKTCETRKRKWTCLELTGRKKRHLIEVQRRKEPSWRVATLKGPGKNSFDLRGV